LRRLRREDELENDRGFEAVLCSLAFSLPSSAPPAERSRRNRRGWLVPWWLALAALAQAFGQGTLEDYQRAERFLPANLERLVGTAKVDPHWIGRTNRFWYRRVDAKGAQFILVDAEQNTSAPALPSQTTSKRSGQAVGCSQHQK
jgi:hypothetical protein